ncbi:hypothetical protein MMC26_003931 [Xylographa opegraphella]|nr:hypothetical protein [Xylographa opegraphella]
MFRILEAQAPTKQNATDTINTLSGRLQSATLVEDRRAAILGLRSFAKVYPASVASGGLRSLINSLNHDGDDVDTTKVVLETLLMLFNPDESSPEASDDIALWLADEFTQRQENITILLDLLDRHEFFSRLYALQLISAISSARPERTQECVYTAPLGVSRLVAILDDKREAVRAEGLLLLTAITASSSDLQKLVAFENAFDRIFAIIDAEGSLIHGSVVVQDCLSLLANLLRLNASNQSFFRETGGPLRVAALLDQVRREEDAPGGVADWAASQRDKNLWGLLCVVRLFLSTGSAGTQVNQIAFWQNDVTPLILEIAFQPTMDQSVRAEALATCADLIRGNSSLQERFAQSDVVSPSDDPSKLSPPKINGDAQDFHKARVTVRARTNVIQGLLDLALAVSGLSSFDLRLAACECIKAYLYGHGPIRLHFLARARDGHISDEYEADNVITILLEGNDGRAGDPYRHWVAAVILFHLLHEDFDAKQLAMEITVGDASKGEEVITCIQSLTENLVIGAQRGRDDRVSIAYLMALCGWLYEDPDAVNDFLGAGSNVQSLIHMVLQPHPQKVLVAGLCAFLLGIIYEFSTKDSPVPRATLHEILTTRLGREHYNDKMTKLRESPLVRDYEVSAQTSPYEISGGLPEVYFDKTFVDFLKDNYSRVLRAMDRDPGIEVSVVANGIQRGISRELVDSLRSQLEAQSKTLHTAEAAVLTVERKLSQEQADHRKLQEGAMIELHRIKSINESLQRHHEEDVRQMDLTNQRILREARETHEKLVLSLRVEAHKFKRESEDAAVKVRTRHEAETNDLNTAIHKLEMMIEKLNKDHAQDLRTAYEEYSTNVTAIEARLQRAEERAAEAEERAAKAQKAVEAGNVSKSATQAELDDLLMVLGDLEEKRAKDKKRLRTLGEPVSDGEAEEGEDEVDAA